MRTAVEILRDMEAATICKQKGYRHKFKFEGEPFNIFFDGPKFSAIERSRRAICQRCGFEKWMPNIEVIK